MSDATYPPVSFRWSTGRGSHVQITLQPAMIGGRLRCRGLAVEAESDDEDVTSEILRAIPVGELVRLAAEQLGIGELAPLPPQDFAKAGMTDQALRDVLAVHDWCVRTGRKPFGVLEREYGIPRPKAARWLARARDVM